MNRALPLSFERLRCPGGWDLEWRGGWRHFNPSYPCTHGVPHTHKPGPPHSAAWPRNTRDERRVDVP